MQEERKTVGCFTDRLVFAVSFLLTLAQGLVNFKVVMYVLVHVQLESIIRFRLFSDGCVLKNGSSGYVRSMVRSWASPKQEEKSERPDEQVGQQYNKRVNR